VFPLVRVGDVERLSRAVILTSHQHDHTTDDITNRALRRYCSEEILVLTMGNNQGWKWEIRSACMDVYLLLRCLKFWSPFTRRHAFSITILQTVCRPLNTPFRHLVQTIADLLTIYRHKFSDSHAHISIGYRKLVWCYTKKEVAA